MKRAAAFLQLIRWPNLVFIALTQLLFYYCLLIPVFRQAGAVNRIGLFEFFLVVSGSVFIAAGGYVINDYFDINIDRINKPGKQVIPVFVSRRWAILWHSLFSLLGVIHGFWAGWRLGLWWLGPANFICVGLLFVYSTTFKKKLLSGNIIIAFLTGWALAIIGFAAYFTLAHPAGHAVVVKAKILRFTLLYGSFAFVISLIREAVKDMEDISGDARFGCRTLPIVAGLNAAKTYVLVWMVVLTGAIILVEIYAAQFRWWLSVLYGAAGIIAPLAYGIKVFSKAHTAAEYHRVSAITKAVMLTGLLSLVFFKIYI